MVTYPAQIYKGVQIYLYLYEYGMPYEVCYAFTYNRKSYTFPSFNDAISKIDELTTPAKPEEPIPEPTPTPTLAPTSIRLSTNKSSYRVREKGTINSGLYDRNGNLIRDRIIDINIYRDGWYAGYGQYSHDPSRGIMFKDAGTYTIKAAFAGDDTYSASTNSISVQVETPYPPIPTPIPEPEPIPEPIPEPKPIIKCSQLLVEKGEWKPISDPKGTYEKGQYYESLGLCQMDFGMPAFYWTTEQISEFQQMGLTIAEISEIPHETTDVIRIFAEKPKIALWVSKSELIEKAKSETERILAEQGETGEVTRVIIKRAPTNWWEWSEGYYVYICIRSPIGVGVAILVALAVMAIFAWCYVETRHYEVQKLKTETHADYSDTVQSLNDLYEKGLITYDQWQAALGNVTQAHEQAQETGQSWIDTITGILPMMIPLVILGLIMSFMPRRRD